MFDKLTEKARRALRSARLEAQRVGLQHIGTEHILLGLVHEDTGVAAAVLERLGADPERIRAEVDKLAPGGTGVLLSVREVRLASASRLACVYAEEEAKRMGRNYIGTEHLLLGLLRDEESTAARVLAVLGITYADASECAEKLLGPDQTDEELDIPAERGIVETVRDLQKQVDELQGNQRMLTGIPPALQKIQEQLEDIKRRLPPT